MTRPVTITLALAVTLLGATTAGGAELRCSVRAVDGAAVTIRCTAGTPNPGDAVQLGFEAPGVGFVPLAGAWRVALVGPGGEVLARPDGDGHGAPQVGYVALVRTAGAVPAGPAPGTPPAAEDRSHLPNAARGPWLGVGLAPDPDGLGGGVRLQAVEPGLAAAAAGLRPDDVILAVDGAATPNPEAFVAELRRHRGGDTVTLRVLRFPDVVEIPARLGLPPLDQPEAQVMIGLGYLNGDGVPADRTLGVAWLQRAAAAGSEAAAQALAELGGGAPAAAAAGRPVAPAQRPWGVFLAGSEEGNRPGFMVVEAGLRQQLALAGVRVRELPPDLPYPRHAAPSAGDVLVDLQALGGGSLLWIHVATGWTKLSFKPDRVEVSCYDPSGALRWSEDAGNVMASSADHSLQMLVEKIGRKLRKHRGDACLAP